MLPTMLPSTAATPIPPGIPTDYIWRCTLEQYHEMVRQGILTDDDRVELLEGWLIAKMPKNPPHRLVNGLLRARLERVLPAGWHVNVHDPITLESSEPEPDITVVRGDLRDYAARHPGPEDLPCLIEISDTTLARDRGIKKRVYARARIQVYWIVNLIDRQVEVYTQPSGPAENPDYAQRQDFGPADTLPVVIDGQEIGRLAVQEFLS
jgi:Uma2 family endonuclease